MSHATTTAPPGKPPSDRTKGNPMIHEAGQSLLANTTAAPAPAAAQAQLQNWITGKVAFYLELDPAGIEPTAPLASYGLDSVYAFALCGDIEDELRLMVEPGDFTTIAGLAAWLAGELATELAGELAGVTA
jgi:acyl carrier protein